MEGVRVTEIDAQCSIKILWQYFDGDRGGIVKDVYYPLLNNDAVIIFKDPSETTLTLNRRHEKWKFLPLPNQVFRKQVVWVESDLSMLVQATGAYEDTLKNRAQVDVSVDSKTQELILTGKAYQIEWAWNYLSSLRDNQFHIAYTLQATYTRSSASKLSNGDAFLSGNAVCGFSSDLPHSVSLSHEPRPQNQRSTTERRHRQDDANETFNKFASLPATNTAAAQLLQSPPDNEMRGTSSAHTAQSRNEFNAEETLLKSERKFHSLDLRETEDNTHGEANVYRSLQVEYGGQVNSFKGDDRVMEFDHTERGPASLPSRSTSTWHSPSAGFSDPSVEMSRKHFQIDKRLKLKIYVDDIVKTRSDAVVNAANWELKNIGGVAGALAKAAGPEMAEECQEIFKQHGSLATAEVVKTKAYGKLDHLQCVIHTVGPIYIGTDTERSVYELTQTFYNCMEFADRQCLGSITLPFISTGIFGMPIEHCVMALVTALRVFSGQLPSNLREIHFINNDINIVCEAIIMVEQLLSIETLESAIQRMEDGKKHFGRHVFPYCQRNNYLGKTLYPEEEHYASWDSSQARRVPDMMNKAHSQYQVKHLSDPTPADGRGSRSSSGYASRTDPRTRSDSLDRKSKTVTSGLGNSQSPQKTGGRDPSPRPQARPRSNSLTTGKSGSNCVKKSSTSELAFASGRHKPVIKQQLNAFSHTFSSKRSMQSAGRTSDNSGNDTDSTSAAGSEVEDCDKNCAICLETLYDPKKLKCGHRFCSHCLKRASAISPRCPKCQKFFGTPKGDQPKDGTMTYSVNQHSPLQGYERYGTIVIKYSFPSGVQQACHPQPGHRYEGTHRTAYLPDNKEGKEVLKLLQKAFDHHLVFTIGDSTTSGATGVLTWNDIHHKTNRTGGPENYGYPDARYLKRVKEELAVKGIMPS